MTTVQAKRHGAPNARAIAEGALLADLTVMVVLIGLYIPYVGPAMAAISPLPLLLLVLRQGWRVAIEAFFAGCLLVAFLTGPFTAIGVLAIALRAFALGIGLRKGWSAGKTVLAGTAFLWAIVCAGVTAAALAFPSWRTATEHSLTFTYRQLTALLGLLLRLAGQGQLWHQLSPHLNDLLVWFLAHWLLLLPLFAWPILLVAVGAEYIIVELMLPRFGFTPPPLRLPLLGGVAAKESPVRSGLRRRLESTLEQKLGYSDQRVLRRSGRRLVPAPVPAHHSHASEPAAGHEHPLEDGTIRIGQLPDGGRSLSGPLEEAKRD